jgi:ribonuclease P protein component
LQIKMPLTWPRQRKILRRSDFTACYERGERRYTRYFVVFAHSGTPPSNGRPGGRLGLAVTRKCGCATRRNRIKRVLREYFRLHQQDMPAMDIVVVPKRRLCADKLCLAMVERDLGSLLVSLRRASAGRSPAPGESRAGGAAPEGGAA